jgi:EAL domain-containing protein (putative c-di-GMP-specific phosphodiesterase class I)
VVVHHGDEVHFERRRETLRWLGGLPEHLRSGRVRLFAQPIRPLRPERSGGAHFEILIRPLGEDGTPQSPGGIIAEAERHGLMETVDRWVVEQTLETLSRLPNDRLRDVETCAINLTGASLGSESLLGFIVDHLGRTRIAPGKICFEVTETTAVGHVGEVRWLMQELRGMGCRFAIDDFGSGMASYGYLRDLPVDYLKIDGTFVRSCARDELDRSIVESIVHVARTLSVRTVAEWVDDLPTAELLRDVGVDYLQGFEFGRPSPLGEVLGASHLRSVPPPALARLD